MFFGWRDLGSALLLIYVAFAVSAVLAAVVLAGLAGRQVRGASELILEEPAMVVGAAFGAIALLMAGIVAIVTVVGGSDRHRIAGARPSRPVLSRLPRRRDRRRRLDPAPVLPSGPRATVPRGCRRPDHRRVVELPPADRRPGQLHRFRLGLMLSWRVFRATPGRAPTEGELAGRRGRDLTVEPCPVERSPDQAAARCCSPRRIGSR